MACEPRATPTPVPKSTVEPVPISHSRVQPQPIVMRPLAQGAPPVKPMLGYLLATLAALGLGSAVAFSRMAYEGGTNGLSVASVRALGVVLLMGVLVRWRGGSLRVPSGMLLPMCGLGVLVAHMFFGNIAAVQYIPVGMTALLFFIYPPLVGLILIVGFGARLSWWKLLAAGTAFMGLALALGVSLGNLAIEGVFLAMSAGVAAAINAIWIGQRFRHVDPFVLTFHMSWVAALVLWGVLIFDGGPVAPMSADGWLGAGAVVVCQVIGAPMYFASLRHAGAEAASMITNIQPIASIGLAYLLYNEVLTWEQGVGGFMVLGGIILMQWNEHRARA
jgi:drug/metabolite transporter (DMT)-like permease